MSVLNVAYTPPVQPACAEAKVTRALLVDHTAKMGGGEIALLNLVRYFDRSQVHPTVLLMSHGPLEERLREEGVDVHVMPLGSEVLDARKDSLGAGSLLKVRAAWSAARMVWRLARFIRAGGYDIVHTNSLKADLIGGLAAKLARVPLVWHIRDRIDKDYLPATVVRVFRLLARHLPDFVLANSNATLRTLELDRRDARSEAVPSGIELSRQMRVIHDGMNHHLSVRAAEVGDWSAPRIILVGRLARWKGQHVFIDAARLLHERYPNARFQIVGSAMFSEDDYEREIRAQVERHGLGEKVEFLGFRKDVPELIAAAHLVVHASITGEPFGQVIIEAMASSKTVVATDGGGVPEIVVDGVTGLLVPMGDSVRMARAICFLLENPELTVRMGELGYNRVREQFTIQNTVSLVERVYNELVQPKQGSLSNA